MTREEFEEMAQQAFDSLPERFRTTIENVRITVKDVDDDAVRRRARVRSGSVLLGLYEGIPLNKRGNDYGMYPVIPDSITLFQRNIEALARSPEETRATIRQVLLHEIGHYYGMTEEEIRSAGY